MIKLKPDLKHNYSMRQQGKGVTPDSAQHRRDWHGTKGERENVFNSLADPGFEIRGVGGGAMGSIRVKGCVCVWGGGVNCK